MARPLPALMLCRLVDGPFDDENWIFEPKYDGLRLLCRFDGRAVELLSRNGKRQNTQFPEIAKALARALRGPAIVDGELICVDGSGRPSFKALQQRLHLLDEAEVVRRTRDYRAELHLFDLLELEGRDLRELPLRRRKELLRESVRWSRMIQWTPETPGEGTAFFEAACREGGEGIIGKRLDSPYSGSRSGDWVKVKCVARQELVVGGFTDPRRSRVGLGALLVGYHGNGGGLVYAGKVGTGFSRETLLELRAKLGRLERPRSPFTAGPAPRGEGVHWVEPRLVAEIGFAEWTRHEILRQPRFEGLRADKAARQVRRELPERPETRRRRAEAMGLGKYRGMRHFDRTLEPKGGKRAAKARRKAPIFVIQKHDATRLHYDLRLEAEGVLKSWAVTNEPTLDPKVKRLAIQVEDHPLEYAGFEGEIPEGEYGAGTVEIWDRGTYEVSGDFGRGYEAGHLKFALHGKKLRGTFALIRMRGRSRPGKPQWLLIKAKDEAARAGAPEPATSTAVRERTGGRAVRLVRGGRPSRVRITHARKLMFPEIDARKEDVLEYYRTVAPYLLPYLRGRPITLERLPEGVEGDGRKTPHFWQKNTPSYYPEWIPRLEIPSETGKPVEYALVNNLETLLYLVNQGALTFHIWPSQLESLDQPDFVLFDLDPGEAGFAGAVQVARELHGMLESESLPSYLKTSGQAGLHVLVPWRDREGGYDEARDWALGLAKRLARALPKLATIERSKTKRHGRVYVDVMQNARGHHVVPPYVLRPVPCAAVSAPLSWEELDEKLDPDSLNIRSMPARIRRLGADPFIGLLIGEEPRETRRKRRAA